MDTQRCKECSKTLDFCLCGELTPFNQRIEVLILQHPSEPRESLGTAWIASKALKNCRIKTALSVPNLRRALSLDADAPINPKRWLVLYLGSTSVRLDPTEKRRLILVDRKGRPLEDRAFAQGRDYDGLIVLDGTWSQAKALWWRNPWLLKLPRAVLVPREKSKYGKLRKEPRRECLSTIESISLALASLGKKQKLQSSVDEKHPVEKHLGAAFQKLIDRHEKIKT